MRFAIIIATLLSVSFSSCSKDDDEGGKSGSKASSYVGYWAGQYTYDSHYNLTLNLGSDGYADYSHFYMDNSSYKTISDYKNVKWACAKDGSYLFIYVTSSTGIKLLINSFTPKSYLSVSMNTTSGAYHTYNLQYIGNGGSSGGGGGSGGGSSSGDRCSKCNGSGKCSRPGYSDNKYYCQGSGVCAECGGSGQMDYKYGSGTITCTWCDGTGKCGYCNGSGKCSKCNGTGRK